MKELLTRENVTLAIAILGLTLSALSWIKEIWESRKNLKVKIDLNSEYGIAFRSSLYYNAFVGMFFENKSKNPIAITYVEIVTREKSRFRCSFFQRSVFHRFQNSVAPGQKPYERFVESAKFPVSVCGLGAAYEYAYFALPHGRDWGDVVSLDVFTNRGKVSIDDFEAIAGFREFLQAPLRENLQTQEFALHSEEPRQ